PWLPVLAGAAGGALAIAGMHALSAGMEFPPVMIPFSTSVVLLLGPPEARPAPPPGVVGGPLVRTPLRLVVSAGAGPGPWSAALAVGLAMIVMHATGTFHPPAGIDPLVVVVNGMPWSFLIAPVGLGVVLLALFAFVWHNLVGRDPDKDRV